MAPESLSSNSGEGIQPELVIMMEQQAALMTRVVKLEVQKLTLPDPTGLTFGPEEMPARGEHLMLIEAVPIGFGAVSARPMDVDDLGDIFGTESRVHDASVRTQDVR